MKLFTTAVLALLPALGSAHCVAQRVRINGAVRQYLFPAKAALLLTASLGQWATRWYSDSQLQQPHSKCKRRKLCLQQWLQDTRVHQNHRCQRR